MVLMAAWARRRDLLSRSKMSEAGERFLKKVSVLPGVVVVIVVAALASAY